MDGEHLAAAGIDADLDPADVRAAEGFKPAADEGDALMNEARVPDELLAGLAPMIAGDFRRAKALAVREHRLADVVEALEVVVAAVVLAVAVCPLIVAGQTAG